MKKVNLSTALLFAGVLFTSFNLSAQQTDLNALQKLEGHWKGSFGKGSLEETWTTLDSCTLLGWGYYIEEGDTLITEQLRIQRIGNYWTFIPIINQNLPVLFTLVESSDSKWVFENKEHDFPQRVTYQISPEGDLKAWIEGTQNGKTLGETYLMHRQP
jgi:hypothetical protein